MKTRKTKRQPVSDGKKFINALHRLFKAKDPVAVHQALDTCLARARTLTHIRSLYSWVVSAHDLSVVNFPQETPSIIPKVTEQWHKMTIYVLRCLPEASSAPHVWRTLYGLCQSSTPLGQAIATEWNNCSRCPSKRQPTTIKEYIKYTSIDETYPNAIREVQSLTPPHNDSSCSLAIGC